ncbi:LETM1 domain-containing protein 1 isoform X2 [Thrips palmi]|uniref:LETM1 domain-containing protein 1 isoform X2 n=1 Tax=Thrips palmi TaxID=161013 RepID=A0A6P9A9L5_THRPL|nr:LETM1 domain-containing protein 1 isoform X2 [Thrips palmi]
MCFLKLQIVMTVDRLKLVRLAHQQLPSSSASPMQQSSATGPHQNTPSAMPPMKSSPEDGSSKQKSLRVTVVSRYMEYLNSYIKILDKKFPAAMNVYRIFMLGTKELLRDMRVYFRLLTNVTWDVQVLRQLSRKELELYQSMPKDMLKILPFLVLSSLPFANYVMFPVAYKYPRQLLCKHYWTLQQKVEFAMQTHRKKLLNQRAVFRGLQLQLDSQAVKRDKRVHRVWSHSIACLGSGQHPQPEDIIQCLPLFRGDPYHLDYLMPSHVNSLLKLHGMHSMWRRRKRLADHASLIHEIDLAILREGGVEVMTQDEMRSACFLRGLNPVNMCTEDLRLWLSQWMKISTQVDQTSLSLLLHCPVLLAYNKPSNWALFH